MVHSAAYLLITSFFVIASPTLRQLEKTKMHLKYWEPCGRNKTGSTECLRTALQYFIPAILRGDMEKFGYQGIEPLFVEELMFKYDSLPDVGGSMSLRNTTVLGFSNFTITKLRLNVSEEKLAIEILFKIPQVDILGQFFIKGKAEEYPVTGSGYFTIVTGIIDGSMKISGVVEKRDRRKAIRINKVKIDPSMDYFSIKADNLFKREPQISWLFATFSSRFSKLVYSKTLPYILSAIENFAKNSMDRMFSALPYHQMFSQH